MVPFVVVEWLYWTAEDRASACLLPVFGGEGDDDLEMLLPEFIFD